MKKEKEAKGNTLVFKTHYVILLLIIVRSVHIPTHRYQIDYTPVFTAGKELKPTISARKCAENKFTYSIKYAFGVKVKF